MSWKIDKWDFITLLLMLIVKSPTIIRGIATLSGNRLEGIAQILQAFITAILVTIAIKILKVVISKLRGSDFDMEY